MVRRRTPKYIAFLDATSGARAAYRRSMDCAAKIRGVVWSEHSKLDPADE